MTSQEKSYRVGDVVELVRDAVEIDPLDTYTEIGVRSFGRGVFHKESIFGADLGSKKVYWIRPRELVFNTVFAWEGAVAVTGEDENGKIGSHRFMTYQVNDDVVDLRYLYYYFCSERGLTVLAAASPGSAGRNRTLGIKSFSAQRVELPELDRQRRIVAKLDQALATVERLCAGDRIAQVSAAGAAAEEHLVSSLIANGWTEQSLGAVAEVNPRRSKLARSEEVFFVPMAAVDGRIGAIVVAERRLAASVTAGYTQFRSGDVIFARITPCMQNGKSAIVMGDGQYGYGSTEFHVIRTRGVVSSQWLHFWVRRSAFRHAATQAFTGTAGQQRVPASFMQSVPVLIPPSREAEQQALRTVCLLAERQHRLSTALSRSLGLRRALRPALLNAAFSDQL